MMIRTSVVLLALAAALSAPAQEAAPPVLVSYVVDVSAPKEGLVKVEMTIENNRDEVVTVGLPVWRPGSYRIQQYAKAIQSVEASAGGKSVEVKKTAHPTIWTLEVGKAPTVVVKYVMKPREVPSLGMNLSEKHYFLEGPSLYFYVKDRMSGRHAAEFKLPAGWKVATGLTRTEQGRYEARDYDTFIDCPTELGTLELHSFVHEGVTFELALHSEGKIDADGMVALHKKIVAEHGKMFGGFPFERYVFLYHFRPQAGGGGLEHLNSTDISMPLQYVQSDVNNLASIASHEFVHLWNVKRIRPVELGPFDYTKEVRSKSLWLSEGGTSYFGDRALIRAGIWTEERYFRHLLDEVRQLQENPARKTQSAEQASWTIWDRRIDDPTPRVDYYNKGELICWLLDLKIRAATEGKKGMDDVMRHLYEKYVTGPAKAGKGAIGVGFEEGGVVKAVNAVSGADFTEFFAKHVSGIEELPYAEVCQAAGLVFEVKKMAALGLVMNGLKVRTVPKGGPAEAAGVQEGDFLKSIDGNELKDRNQLATLLAKLKVGDKVKAVFERSEKNVELDLVLSERESGEYALRRSAAPTGVQKEILAGWLGKTLY